MDVEALPPADRLWWSFAVRAALAAGRRDRTWTFDSCQLLLRYDDPRGPGGRLRMQRLHGGRVVLWGRTDDTAASRSWTGIPGWATSDAVREWLRSTGATFVAWHSRDGWDTATPGVDLTPAVGPVLADDLPEELVEAAATGPVEPGLVDRLLAGLVDDAAPVLDVLRGAAGEAAPVQGTVRSLLAGEIRAQMRLTAERPRVLPQRPVQLVRWARIANLPPGFVHAVHLHAPGDLVPAVGNTALAPQFRTTLDTLLRTLHLEEADPASGGWLFARITHDGLTVHLDRAFDGRPGWYEDDGPTLDALAAEMTRRRPAWRPAWSRLLPGGSG
jgi:hypothetical protein